MQGVVVALLLAWSVRIAAGPGVGPPPYEDGVPSLPTMERPELVEIHRALGLIEYVIGDYPEAVGGDGTILDHDEYDEQRRILAEVRGILAPERGTSSLGVTPHGSPGVNLLLLRDLAGAQRLVSRHAPSSDVQEVLRDLWRDVVEHYDLSLTPPEVPSLERGRLLYAQACAACHGTDGHGETAVARLLETPPRDLQDARLDETLSPARVYHAVAFGIPGTAMPAFEGFEESERWDLAFHVLALRQADGAGRTACVLFSADAASGPEMVPSTEELAGMSDAALGHWLREAAVPEDCVDVFRARIRRRLEW